MEFVKELHGLRLPDDIDVDQVSPPSEADISIVDEAEVTTDGPVCVDIRADEAEQERNRAGKFRRFSRLGGRLAVSAAMAVGAVGGASVALRAFPYNGSVKGVEFEVQGSLGHDTGLGINTSLGNQNYPNFDGLPIGVHLTPKNINVLAVEKQASPNPSEYVTKLEGGIKDQETKIGIILGLEALGGGIIGAGLAGSLVDRANKNKHPHELRHRALQVGAVVTALSLAAASYGVVSYNEHWLDESHSTGTLAAAGNLPDQLRSFYKQNDKATDVMGAVNVIGQTLRDQADNTEGMPPTAFNIMIISDMHLLDNYPLLETYIDNDNVRVIINTGDEAEFGTRAEMTDTYIDSIKAITKKVPMIWIAGNHDSPETIAIMRSIPGVIVLGTKTENSDGSYSVAAGITQAYGLTIGGIPDPRVYGGTGAYGSDANKVTDPLETKAVDQALSGVSDTKKSDIFMTHEPIAAREIMKILGNNNRQINAGHLHRQNRPSSIQTRSNHIYLVEGSTGQGGLDKLSRPKRVPMEFSVESVAPNCQFTKVTRVQIASPTLPKTNAQAANDKKYDGSARKVSVDTRRLKPQKIDKGRTCSVDQGAGKVLTLPTQPNYKSSNRSNQPSHQELAVDKRTGD